MFSCSHIRTPKAFIKLSAIAIAMAGLTACGGDDDDDDVFFADDNTVSDIVVDDERFTTLESALQAANLVDALDAPTETFTVFAPTDAAFANLPPATLEALQADIATIGEADLEGVMEADLADLDDTQAQALRDARDAEIALQAEAKATANANLRSILLYHVIGGSELDSSAVLAADGTRIETLSGKYVDISVTGDESDDDNIPTEVRVESSLVTITDIPADNGIIHVIDAVLIPQGNIVDVASETPLLSTLATAVTAAGLGDTLSNEDSAFTVFAPTNDAFIAAADTVDPILGTLNDDDASDEDKASALETLQSVLTYHVVASQIDSSAALAAAPVYLDTVNGNSVFVSKDDNDNLSINGQSVSMGGADIDASNGVIHTIDGLLLPLNIVDTLQLDSRFSTLVDAVIAADLAAALSDADGQFTVFAPTNAAFEALESGTLDSLLLAENQQQLRDILSYHVLDSSVPAADALTLDGERVTTLGGKQITLSVDNNGTEADGSDDELFIDNAQVTITDIKTTNGIIHVIDAVLLPKPNIVEFAQSDNRFTTLVEAVIAADLVDVLSNEEATFTLFAPTNEAFGNLPDGLLDELLLPENQDELASILTYHVLATEVDSETALTLNRATPTTVQGSTILITVDGDMIDINDANVIDPDQATSNGIIHVIDAVLIPPSADSDES